MRSLLTAQRISQRLTSRSRDAQELLPLLVRKLIQASLDPNAIKSCRFPDGDEIGLSGPDGILVVDEDVQHPFIPSDLSLWELGTSGDPKKKADKDLAAAEKKLATAFPHVEGEMSPDKATFVFVTRKSWDFNDWIAKAKKRTSWKDIRVLDAVALEEWLRQNVAVRLWFCSECGIPATGLYSPEEYIKEIGFELKDCVTASSLLLAGRDDAVASLQEQISSNRFPIRVMGESVEESAAFIAASICVHGTPDMPDVVLADHSADIALLASECPEMILVPLDNEALRNIKRFDQSRCRIIEPLMKHPAIDVEAGGIELGYAHRDAMEQSLVGAGYTEHEADQLARESKGSLTALRWMIDSNANGKVEWADSEHAPTHAALLLLGSWRDDNAADRTVVERITGKNYQDVQTLLLSTEIPDGPWVRRGNQWLCVSQPFAYSQLASMFTDPLLTEFGAIFSEVMGEDDPMYELPADDRYLASVLGKVREYSQELRGSLAESVAFLAHADSSGKAWASHFVRSLLDPEHAGVERRWLSNCAYLSSYAEAAPSVFLDALEGYIKKHGNSLFQESTAMFGPSSPHIQLLWALERLAWIHEYFSRVMMILARLAKIDPGGHSANTPHNSLVTILLPWSPQHSEDIPEAAKVLDLIYRISPETAWSVADQLLPEGYSTTTPTPRPVHYKSPPKREVSIPDYWGFSRIVLERMIAWVSTELSRWPILINAYPDIRRGWDEAGALITEALSALSADSLDEETRFNMDKSFRQVLCRFGPDADDDFALSEEDQHLLSELRLRFSPQGICARSAPYFSYHDEFPEAPTSRYSEELREWQGEKQVESVERILGKEGICGILGLLEWGADPSILGQVLSKHALDDDALSTLASAALKDSIGSTGHKVYEMWRAYAGAASWQKADTWLPHIENSCKIEWTPQLRVNLALSAYPSPSVWGVVEQWGKEEHLLYWGQLQYHTEEHYATVLDKWHVVGRPYSAIRLLSFATHWAKKKPETAPTAEQVLKALEAGLDCQNRLESESAPGQHDIEELFAYLDSMAVEQTRLALLEWGYLKALDRTERGWPTLQKELFSSPEFFIQLVSLGYLAEDEERSDPPPSESRAALISNAHTCLSGVNGVPGQAADGTVSRDALLDWVNQSRKLAEKAKRLRVCDSVIGDILSHSPYASDGTWPCAEVRDVIEHCCSDAMDSGFQMGKYNQRGVICRGKGGAQEWKLCDQYAALAEKVRMSCPRTASILDTLSQGYSSEADKWDQAVRWNEFM